MTELDRSVLLPLAVKPDPIMVRGQGSWLWDHERRQYLDFVQGWAVNCLGHCSPVIQRALAEQAGLLINASPAYYNQTALELASALTRRAGLDHAFLCSTGAEANEGAIKLARKWGAKRRAGAYEIITAIDSFHGRTLATMAATGKPGFAAIFPPVMPGFVHVPFGDLAATARAITDKTAAIMVEPIQGEAGVVMPPDDYIRGLRELTEQHGILLILDEIQTGMGRTGTLFAFEHAGVRPDILTLGKSIGAGVPLAAVLNRRDAHCFEPGDQGGTYTGHPLMAAVGLAVLRELTSPGFLEHVRAAGMHLATGLTRIADTVGAARPRGVGLLWALPLPAPKGAEVVAAALGEGLLLNSPRPGLLRFSPALNVSLSDIDEMLVRLSRSLRGVL